MYISQNDPTGPTGHAGHVSCGGHVSHYALYLCKSLYAVIMQVIVIYVGLLVIMPDRSPSKNLQECQVVRNPISRIISFEIEVVDLQ